MREIAKCSHKRRQSILIEIVYLFVAIAIAQVYCDDTTETVGKTPVEPIDTSGDYLASNRVLPVDADHKRKISAPLEPYCVENIRENLKKFLKRHPKRQGRQDDDDGEEEGIAGIIGNIGEGNGALSTLSMLPSVLPQLVSTLTQLSGAVNQGLNGTDTPNIPSFLVRQGMEAVKFFQAIAGAAQANNAMSSRLPSQVHVQRIPGQSGPPNGRPVPGSTYEPYPSQIPGGGSIVPGSLGNGGPLPPDLDPLDYIDEDVKQHLQPTLAPLLRPGGGTNGGSYAQGGSGFNPFLQNVNQLQNEDPAAAGLPQGTSLWNIYKSFRTRPEGVNGTLSDFQLAHPEAFSNELLQSISSAISAVRGQMAHLSVPTDRPSSEIFKQFYPENNETKSVRPPSLVFSSPNKPTLSVYKPSGSISGGVGVDLSNLALNASQNILETLKTRPKPNQQEEPDDNSVEATSSASAQQDVEGAPEGTQRPGVKPGATLVNTGSLDSLKQQQNNGPQFVKSPTSSHLSLQMGEYIPSITSLHEDNESLQKVGQQVSSSDQMNGFGNKAPYTPVLNGILLEAPRLTPAPIYQKRPSGLIINTNEAATTRAPAFTTPFPEFHFQTNRQRPDLPPNYHGPDPTTRRPSTLIASIPTKFEYDQERIPVKAGSGVAPPNLFQQVTDAVPESDVEASTPSHFSPPPQQLQAQYAPPSQQLQSQFAPPPQPPRLSQAQQNAQKLLQQLLFLQSALQRQQQNRLQQNVQVVANAFDRVANPDQFTSTTTTPPPPPPPPPPQLPQLNFLPPAYVANSPTGNPNFQPTQINQNSGNQLQSISNQSPPVANKGASAIASGFANLLANNYSPPGSNSALLAPNKNTGINNRPAFINNRPVGNFGNAGNFQNSAPNVNYQSPAPISNLQNPAPNSNFQNSASASNFQNQASVSNFQNPLLNSNFQNPLLNSNFQNPLLNSNFQNPPNPSLQNPSPISNLQNPAPISNLQNPAPIANIADPVPANLNNFAAPIRTTTSTPQLKPPSSTTLPPNIRFQQFPSFVQGPTSYLPPSTNNFNAAARPSLSTSSSSSSSSPSLVAPTITKSTNPILNNLINPGSDPLKIPETTLAPITGAFSPYQPFGSFSNLLQHPPSALKASTTPSTLSISTSTTKPTISTLPPLSSFNFVRPQGGYYPAIASVPASEVPSAISSSGPPPLPPPSAFKPSPRPTPQDPYFIVNNPTFQNPGSTNSGYPQHLPLVTASNFKSPSSSAPLAAAAASTPKSVNTSVTQHTTVDLPASTLAPATSAPKIVSALSEMAKLPFYQEDSFRPSVVPPYLYGGTSTSTSENHEDSSFEEQVSPSSEKPFKELFSNSANVSVESTTVAVAPPKTVPSFNAEENDSAEQQPYPNFPPGKPVYWMNMYYPDGVPVLMKVTTTTPVSTSAKPRRRKTKVTTTTERLSTEPEYYEEDDIPAGGGAGDEKKAKRRKKIKTTTEVVTTTEADFKTE